MCRLEEMLFQLILGTLLLATTVTVHGVFMVTYLGGRGRSTAARSFWAVIRILAQLAIWCVFAHVVEILIWAAFYTGADVMPDLETAGTSAPSPTRRSIWRHHAAGGVAAPTSMEGSRDLMCVVRWFIFAVVSRLLATEHEAW
jgi:hypothetical protein